MTVVREDKKSIYVIAGGYISRPGNVNGYSHAVAMDDANLKKGDVVKAKHKAGTPLTIIKTEEGKTVYWHHAGLSPEMQKFCK